MISVVIPTLNAEAGLPACLTALVPGMVDGLVREVIVVDGGSTDRTLAIADEAGVDVVRAPASGRGAQLALGASKARHPWLLFLHADTVLDDSWVREVHTLIDRIGTATCDPAHSKRAATSRDEHGEKPDIVAAFRFALDEDGLKARLLEAAVALRCALFKLPYGDQGLLISRRRYDALGGFKPLKLMEDVELVRRIPRRDRLMLRTTATTSAARYRRDGYLKRSARNLACLTLYTLRAPSTWIERVYGL